jgi:fructoselysine 6-kinase
MKVACFSVAAMDYFPQQKEYFAGGNALNQSVRMSSLGEQCTFLGALGNDQHGKRIYSLLKKHGVDLSLTKRLAGSTANNRIVNDESGERFGETDAWQGGVFETFKITEESWQQISDFDIWTTHSSCPNFQQTLARKRSAMLCVDYLHLPDPQPLYDSIHNVDIAYVGGELAMSENLLQLSTVTKTLIVLTLGAQGSMAFYKGQQYVQPALSTKVIDTTGCGDAFQAGFTLCYSMTKDIAKALLSGAELGQKATRHYGGVQW